MSITDVDGTVKEALDVHRRVGERAVVFFDAVMAIAITLLVLEIDIPNEGHFRLAQLQEAEAHAVRVLPLAGRDLEQPGALGHVGGGTVHSEDPRRARQHPRPRRSARTCGVLPAPATLEA